MLSSFFTSKADILIWCHHCMLILSANLFIDLIAQVEKLLLNSNNCRKPRRKHLRWQHKQPIAVRKLIS